MSDFCILAKKLFWGIAQVKIRLEHGGKCSTLELHLEKVFSGALPYKCQGLIPPGNPLVAVETTSGASLLICTLLFSSMWRSFFTVL